MNAYYYSITILSWAALIVLSVLVYENDRIEKRRKWPFYITYLVIALSSLFELIGVVLNGRSGVPAWCLVLVKTLDYCLTPMAGGVMVLQMRMKSKWNMAIFCMVLANILFQIVAAFTGQMTIVNEDHTYSHGPLFIVYLALSGVILLTVFFLFVLYGNTFRRKNRISLYAIMVLLILGIFFQEGPWQGSRTIYITFTLGAAFLFIHYTEFDQIKSDDRIQEQFMLITTDPLTGVLSRHAYSMALREYDDAADIPKNFAFFLLDIDGLKLCNDISGHEAGDELIRGAVDCITATVGKGGRTFRIGCDEFVVLRELTKEEAVQSIADLKQMTKSWTGEKVKTLGISVGYVFASDAPGLNAEHLFKLADEAMYVEKKAFYESHGLDRRRPVVTLREKQS